MSATLRNELALFLKKNKGEIVDRWSKNIFVVPGHRKFMRLVPLKVHIKGMNKFITALAHDIRYPKGRMCDRVLNRLILKDFLGLNTSEDTVHGQMLLRAILADMLLHAYKDDINKLSNLREIMFNTTNKGILCTLGIYRRRNYNRLQTILKYGKRLIRVHTIDRLCHLILEAAAKESSADRASLMLLEKDGYLHIKSFLGIPKRIAVATRQRLNSGIAGRVAASGKPFMINRGQRIEPSIKRALRGLGICSAVSIPIIADSQTIGVLNLGKYKNKPFFDEEDLELLVIFGYEAGAAIHNCRLFEEMHSLYMGTIISLAAAIDTRDHYTHGHSNRVSRLAVNTARLLELSNETIEKVELASTLHDIGKIGVPDNILLKPGALTKKEWEIIKRHPIYAVNILKHVPRLKPIIPIIYHEHERYDGKGYVDGIKGDNIPIESRIIAVADAYEAMTSNRPYRKALSDNKAISRIKDGSGTQFDPKVVKAFLKIIKR